MIKLFFADPMTSTPFVEPAREECFASTEVEVVDNPQSADVLVSRQLANLRPFFPLERRYYVWTHEPAWLPTAERYIEDVSSGIRVSASTAFNGDIYQQPLYYFPFRPTTSREVGKGPDERKKECVFLGTYRAKFDRHINGVNVDITEYRQLLAKTLHDRGRCDIFGRSWPENIAVAESRGKGWHRAKLEIIRDYRVNIALENTVAPNYVTEKLWDAIRGGCVPVYFGRGSGVYDVLPRDAFIDASELGSWEQVATRLGDLTLDEAEGIVMAGAQAVEELCASYNKDQVRAAVVRRFCERVQETMASR